MGKFIFVTPILLVLLAVVVYFVFIPQVYGETVSIVDWLLTDSQKILSMLRKGSLEMPRIREIVALEIFWWVWLALFVASLFFVGKRLQNPEKIFSSTAILKNHEPHVLVQNSLSILRQYSATDELEEVIGFVKKLSDRLANESDFGRGNPDVIDCENDIANLISLLSFSAKSFQTGDSGDNAKEILKIVKSINSLLASRSNLEKHR